ncbi:VOC family protein [Streptomyces sp. OF3]|uniref:VOC family protein n=1 Tax=Streptomyces alkaliterrae TaxID=2213162 RepID=A0A7W3WM15_9ACTN|nr:VOC family protein [Streptomyces alkaliterrae]MBB1254370.1 VOC family protein [Streptomyces alkaliterrae]
MTEKAIPMLHCREIRPVVDFYTALGFETTFLQKSPYPYAIVERGAVELHFFGNRAHDPASSVGGCYILTDEVDAMHEAFREGLRSTYGRIPSRGLPRIGPLKDMSYGMRQFLMTDPAGNSIRVGQQTGGDGSHAPVPKEPVARALHLATLFADAKEDLPGAARIIDRALERKDAQPAPAQLVRLLTLRGDVAHRMGEDAEAGDWLRQAAEVELSVEERDSVAEALDRLAELRGGA